jgi:hypothetical protein
MRSSPSPERRRAAAAALLVALAACARPAPVPAPPAPGATGDALAAVRQRAAAVRTLRAQFDATARFPGGERAASGVLIVRPPDDARLRLVAPFGLTVFDGLRTGGRTYVSAPLAADRARDTMALMRAGPADSVLFGGAAIADCAAAADPAPQRAAYWCGTPATRWIVIDRATGTLESETEVENGAPAVRRTYGDYRLVDGVPLPYRIVVEYPPRHLRVDIAVTRYEVNPPLRDDQFAPPTPG